MDSEDAGKAVARTAESTLDAATEKIKRIALQDRQQFERQIKSGEPITINLSAVGFTVPSFEKKLIAHMQANVRILWPSAPSSGHLSSHIPVVLARAKESYDTYKTSWPLVDKPFLDAAGKPITFLEVCCASSTCCKPAKRYANVTMDDAVDVCVADDLVVCTVAVLNSLLTHAGQAR